MLLNRYERTATGIRLDVGGSHIDLVADDALTLLAYLLRDKARLSITADDAALARVRAARQSFMKPLNGEVTKNHDSDD